MLGLDAAGKTTILYRLHMGEVLSTVPTVGRWPVSLSITYLPTTLNHWGVSGRFYSASWLPISLFWCIFEKDCTDYEIKATIVNHDQCLVALVGCLEGVIWS